MSLKRKPEVNVGDASKVRKVERDVNWWKTVIRDSVYESILTSFRLTEHHTSHFDDLVNIWLKSIVLNCGTISTALNKFKCIFTLKNYRFVRGELKPSAAHKYNVSYVGHIYVDIEEIVLTNQEPVDSTIQKSEDPEFKWILCKKNHLAHKICDFPIMLLSSACYLSEGFDVSDQCEPEWGGGFIVKGKRRFIPLLKSLVKNYPYRFIHKNKNIHYIQVRSEHLNRRHRSTSTLELLMDTQKSSRSLLIYNCSVKIPFLVPTVPLTIMIIAFGFSIEGFISLTKKMLRRKLSTEKLEKYLIMFENDHRNCLSQEKSLLYINKLYGKDSDTGPATQILQNEVLPHLNGSGNVLKSKFYYLSYIYSVLILFKEGVIEASNRDEILYSRITNSATSLAMLFRMEFLTFIKQGLKIVRRSLKKNETVFDTLKIYNHDRLSQKILSAVATGIWSAKRKGVSHPMMTTNNDAIIAQLRRISSSYLNNDGKHLPPRMVQSDGLGYICAAECFDPWTPILTWNGSIKLARNIVVGDILINDKGRSTKVRSICSGTKRMYRIEVHNHGFLNYTVTDNHILTLKIQNHFVIREQSKNILFVSWYCRTNKIYRTVTFDCRKKASNFIFQRSTSNIVDITVSDYLKLSSKTKQFLKIFKCAKVHWPFEPVPKDPYKIGYFMNTIHKLPMIYIINSISIRRQLLAGIIDQCGIFQNQLRVLEVFLSNTLFIDQMLLLCGSLGIYSRYIGNNIIHISLDCNTNLLPTRLKLIPISLSSSFGTSDSFFSLVELEHNNYVGWQLNGSGRFLLADFSVTHNTPEGESCGLIDSLACTARITKASDVSAFKEVFIQTLGPNFIKFTGTLEESWLQLDYYTLFDSYGCIYGYVTDIDDAINCFVKLRRSLSIDPFTTYHVDNCTKELWIFCDIGRLVRPLLIIENLKKLPGLIEKKYNTTSLIPALLQNGCLEYVSAAEERVIKPTYSFAEAFSGNFTHLEVSDVSFVGIMAALAPFFRHNQGPRLVYWIGMSKQTICCSQKDDIGAATTHSLWYGQKPVVHTKTAKLLNMDQYMVGINCTVIFYPLSYNQEDAIIMNRAAVDRGLFISDSIRTYDATQDGALNDKFKEIFEKPVDGQVFGRKIGSYDKLRSDGLPRPGDVVKGGDVIIGKTIPIKQISAGARVHIPEEYKHNQYTKKKRDKSIQVRKDEEGVVSSVFLARKANMGLAKVRVKTTRIPEVGDKFSSRHSQSIIFLLSFLCCLIFIFYVTCYRGYYWTP